MSWDENRLVFVPLMQSSRLVFPHPLWAGLHVSLYKQASKVEYTHSESGHCWINWRDAECDWLRGYDVTLWFETLDDWDQAWRGAHPESAGQRSKEDIRWGILEITIGAQGDGCYDVEKKLQKKAENEAVIQLWQNHLRAHSDPLKAIMKQDANLISHLGSNKPNVTGSFS